MLVIYESGPSGRAWKGDRVSELMRALSNSGCYVYFFGLRGLFDFPLIVSKSSICFLFSLPSQAARFANIFNVSKRDLRARISRTIFFAATFFFKKTTVITQTTLGGLASRLKIRGHRVWAECDMTCPKAWRKILLKEADRLDAYEEMQDELPSKSREIEEAKAFESADKIIVFSAWAMENLPAITRRRAVVIPSVSVRPRDHILDPESDTWPIEFMFVGQLSFRKGFHVLIEAMRTLEGQDQTCHAYGGLRENFRLYMERTGLNIPSNLHAYGAGDWRRFVRENPRRYVAVLPSFVEGSPRFIYEAAAMGIPSIISPAARPSFFEDDRDALVLKEPDAISLGKAMMRFQNEHGLWKRLSAQAFANYSHQYGKNSYGEKVAALLLADQD